eukprot:85121-Hanusia_phi.AAC.11
MCLEAEQNVKTEIQCMWCGFSGWGGEWKNARRDSMRWWGGEGGRGREGGRDLLVSWSAREEGILASNRTKQAVSCMLAAHSPPDSTIRAHSISPSSQESSRSASLLLFILSNRLLVLQVIDASDFTSEANW